MITVSTLFDWPHCGQTGNMLDLYISKSDLQITAIMIIEFYTPDGGVDESIITYVRDEIIKLHKLHKAISRSDISFRQKIRKASKEKICEISLFIAGNTINAKGICKNFDHASKKAMAALHENLVLSFKQKVHAL